MRCLVPIAAALLLAACGQGVSEPGAANAAADNAAAPAGEGEAPGTDGAGWDLVASGEGTGLLFRPESGAALSLFCPADRAELLVNVPGFRPVGSEERMTFGSGGEAETLVADPAGDAQRGGVSGTGAVPGNLAALIAGPVAVNYGAQNSGPHPAPPAEFARNFVAACREGAAAPAPPAGEPTTQPAAPKQPAGNVSACLMQNGTRLSNPPLRAIGTEPFWGARIQGRCVTYSHPEDIEGTRIWTTFRPGEGGGGRWSGALDGRLFELTIRPRPGCSDGMSDRRYPYEAVLMVKGERRRGCAEPG